MSAEQLEWRVEALCTAARPALHREIADGWSMGRSGGRMRQANCVNPLPVRRGHPAPAIERGEMFYEKCGQPPLFRVPTIAGEMDPELERRGYGAEGQTTTLFNLLELPTATGGDTVLSAGPSEDWLAVRQRTSGDALADHGAYRSMVEFVALPKVFAATYAGGEAASIAYGVVADGLLAVEGVATDIAFRGQGLSRLTLQTLIAWGWRAGARAACLQVQLDNAAALTLYTSLGFQRELYRYHYRRRPS